MAQPMYRLIAEDLRQQIESGELQPGTQLPPEYELRDRYRASRNTVRDALRWLTTRGLVTARAGQGTFVAARIDPFVTMLSGRETVHYASEVGSTGQRTSASARRTSTSAPRVEIQQAARELADMLLLPEGTEIVSRQHVRHIDGTPWSLQTSFYPRELVTRGAERLLAAGDFPEGVLAYLEDACGLVQVGYLDRILVGPPDKDEAGLFSLADDGRVSMITVLRTCYTAGDQGPVPFRVTITAYPADRNQLLISSGEVS
jgi:GntR family transcriptional regulator